MLARQERDIGSLEFMGCGMGLGIFVGQAGPNRVMVHQAANDGFRGFFFLCFDGPDYGKGLVCSTGSGNSAISRI